MAAKAYPKKAQVPQINPGYLEKKMKSADEKQPNLTKPTETCSYNTDYGRKSK